MVVGPAAVHVITGPHGQSLWSRTSPTGGTPDCVWLRRFETQKHVFNWDCNCIYTQPTFRLHSVPHTVPRFHGKYDVEERLGPFSVGGGTAFPCVLLHFKHCKYGTKGVLLSHSNGFEPESRT